MKKLTGASIVTAVRLVFFAVFVWATQEGLVGWAAVTFVLAWGLDIVDGWLARRLRQETDFGYVFDKATDRLVLMGGIVILLVGKLVPDYVFLILVKDIAVLPAVGFSYVRGRRMPDAGVLGKVVVLLQGMVVVWALLGWPELVAWVAFTAVFGGLVGYGYVLRVYREGD